MINNTSSSLELISLVSSNTTESIRALIARLNFTVMLRDPDDWLEQKGAVGSAVSVLILGDSVPKITQRILSTEISKPYLTVFCGPRSKWDHEIAALSTDFCGWPCEKRELALRLAHLLSNPNHHLTAAAMPVNEAEWIGLNLIGSCAVFLKVKSLIRKTACCDAPIFIEGETGTGKEVAARAIHYLGPRKDQPFIPINCGALPDSLIENELFGHEKGAYTDAKQHQHGLISQADGGTLFLDEIEALSSKGQVSLLRFTDDQNYKPLGSKNSKKADIRIISASNTPLSELTADGRFRKDLLFRLNVINLALPSLKERTSDIEQLAEHFMQRLRAQYQQPDKKLHPDTIMWMAHYDWPGNIRELENYIHRAFLLADGLLIGGPAESATELLHDDQSQAFDKSDHPSGNIPFSEAKKRVIERFERRYLSRLLTKTKGNVTHAAELANKERRTFGKLLKKHGIDKDRYRIEH